MDREKVTAVVILGLKIEKMARNRQVWELSEIEVDQG